jgi:hypothetical protein
MDAVNVVATLEDWLRKSDAPLREMRLEIHEVRKFQAENKASVSLKGNVLATIEVWGHSKTLDFCIMESSDTDVQAQYYDFESQRDLMGVLQKCLDRLRHSK